MKLLSSLLCLSSYLMALNFTWHIIVQSLNFVRWFCYSSQSPLTLFTFSSFVLSANFLTSLGQSSFLVVLWINILKDTRTDTCRTTMVASHTARTYPLYHESHILLLHGCWNSLKSPFGNPDSLQQLICMFPDSFKTLKRNLKWDFSLKQAYSFSGRLYLSHDQ